MNTLSPNTTEIREGEIFTFYFGSDEIRGIPYNGAPWVLAKDLCDAVGIVNSRDALKNIPEDELMSLKATSGGQVREMNFLSEPGMYRLLFRSNKPEAEPFVRWVTHEVLPSIRKRGVYVLESRVAELSQKVGVRTDMYFNAMADLRKAEERYRKSHTAVSERERSTIRGLLMQHKSLHEVAELSCRSVGTVRKIKQEMGA